MSIECLLVQLSVCITQSCLYVISHRGVSSMYVTCHSEMSVQYYNTSVFPYVPAPGRTRTIIAFLAVLGMPMEMYGEGGKRGLQSS